MVIEGATGGAPAPLSGPTGRFWKCQVTCQGLKTFFWMVFHRFPLGAFWMEDSPDERTGCSLGFSEGFSLKKRLPLGSHPPFGASTVELVPVILVSPEKAPTVGHVVSGDSPRIVFLFPRKLGKITSNSIQ